MNFWDFLFGTVALFFLWLIVNKWLKLYFNPINSALRQR